MFSVNWVYGMWANEFRERLIGGFFDKAISFDKDTLFLQFVDNQQNPVTLECKFIEGHLLLFISDKTFDASDGKKGIFQFKEIENQSIQRVSNDVNDRWICFTLGSGLELWLKGFGKFGNVLLRAVDSGEILSIFRLSLKNDWDFNFPVHPIPTEEPINSGISLNKEDFLALGFVQCPTSIHDIISVQQSFLRDYFFLKNKNLLKDQLERKIKHLKKILTESNRRLQDIEHRRSNKEIGDLILAHAHSLKPGLSKALVTDYYTDQRIWIKLNPELNASDNAKKYYGKAKNEVIERKKLIEQLTNTEINLKDAEEKLSGVLLAEDFKGLKSFQKGIAPPVTQADTLPYKLHEFQGYQIWVGKNNKSNDQMLRMSQKNDMWLHAKDVAGSHVIIRKKGASFPQAVIDFAAKLAAQNSKAKTQNVVPVIAVLRKFVSKPKQAAPGEVSLQKEDIVDAFIG